MHKKLEADLISLAHSILQMKNKDDVFALDEKAKIISSKLSMLAFVETYINSTPHIEETKEELISKVEKAFEKKEELAVLEDEAPVIHDLEITNEEEVENIEVEDIKDTPEKIEEEEETEDIEEYVEDIIEETEGIEEEAVEEEIVEAVSMDIEETVEEAPQEVEADLEQPFEELEETLFSSNTPDNIFKDDPKDVGELKIATLEEELKDTFPVDVMANLFETAQPKSLNDVLTKNIQIGLNDRIAFVKNLFDGSQEDFNRVVSQLNSFKTEKEAKKFINKMVKPDYNWTEQEEFEVRFMEIVQRKFV